MESAREEGTRTARKREEAGAKRPGLDSPRAIRVRKRLVDQLRVDGALNRALKTLLERARIFAQDEHTQLVALALVPAHLPGGKAKPRLALEVSPGPLSGRGTPSQ